jgi:Fe-S cluster assembly iron-binding protein IscA
MVNVTERAKDQLKNLLDARGDHPSVGLRLGTTAWGQYSVFPDRERGDDEVVEYHGSVVLLVGQDIAQMMGGTTIDCDERAPNPRLVLTHD